MNIDDFPFNDFSPIERGKGKTDRDKRFVKKVVMFVCEMIGERIAREAPDTDDEQNIQEIRETLDEVFEVYSSLEVLEDFDQTITGMKYFDVEFMTDGEWETLTFKIDDGSYVSYNHYKELR